MWGRPAVQVLVTLLDEPRLEGALRQCRPLVAGSQYSAKVRMQKDILAASTALLLLVRH